jgi:hypothetical protein
MNFIRRLLTPATNATTKLGRWQLHYDPKVVHSKVDQANEDHCGCCGESAEQMKQREQSEQTKQMKQMKQRDQKQKWQKWQEKKQHALYAESEKYYIPYVM